MDVLCLQVHAVTQTWSSGISVNALTYRNFSHVPRVITLKEYFCTYVCLCEIFFSTTCMQVFLKARVCDFSLGFELKSIVRCLPSELGTMPRTSSRTVSFLNSVTFSLVPRGIRDRLPFLT